MGSIGDPAYSVPKEARRLLDEQLLNNKLLPQLPSEIHDAAKHVRFSGNEAASIPVNWRFAESVSALKGFEAAMLNVLRAKKYNVGFDDVSIDTDHASLFIMTPFIAQKVEKDGSTAPVPFSDAKKMAECGIKNTDLHRAAADLHRGLATNIYRTKDGRYYHTHGQQTASF